jgi:hypothetical protein
VTWRTYLRRPRPPRRACPVSPALPSVTGPRGDQSAWGAARIDWPGSAVGLNRKRAGTPPRPARAGMRDAIYGPGPGCPAQESRDLGVPCSRNKLSPRTPEHTRVRLEPPPRPPGIPTPACHAVTGCLAGSETVQRCDPAGESSRIGRVSVSPAGTLVFVGARFSGSSRSWPHFASAGETPVLPVGRELPVPRAVPSSHSRLCPEYSESTLGSPDPADTLSEGVRPLLGNVQGGLPKTGATPRGRRIRGPLGLTVGVSAGCDGGS